MISAWKWELEVKRFHTRALYEKLGGPSMFWKEMVTHRTVLGENRFLH